MARHSHWAQIKLKKGALDKKRGKIFTKHARLIEMAARKAGGNPDMNAGLRLAIENARADNMPRENIDRAIKKGTGELTSEELFEATYEGYGPAGVALVIDVLTNNKNRSAQVVRNTLQKFGGSLGGVGATSFLFETKGLIQVKGRGSAEEDELALIDLGAEDIEEGEGGFVLFFPAAALGSMKKKIEAAGFCVTQAQLTRIPKISAPISDAAAAQKIIDLMEALEEEDDVANVAANFEIEDGK